MTEFTTNLRLYLTDFNQTTWHDEMHDNFRIIDAAFQSALGLSSIQGIWTNSTAYVVGNKLFDENGELYRCEVDHVSAAAPTTFAQDRVANPTYWTLTTGQSSAVIDAIAALVPSDDTMINFTGSATAELLPITDIGKSIISAASAAAERALLGLGAAALLGTPIPVASGGSGSGTQAGARTNFGLDAMLDTFDMYVLVPTDQIYVFTYKAAFAGEIVETTSVCTAGTCTAQFKINGVNLDGAANAVSVVEQSQAHAVANEFAAGDTVSVTISANAACLNMALTVKYQRKVID